MRTDRHTMNNSTRTSQMLRRVGAAAWTMLLLGVAGHGAASAQVAARATPQPVVLRVPDARIPVELAQARVQAQIVGSAARTRVELLLRNPNARALEGELQFPLLPGQTVAGFALDIDGELRPAVPVEKAKGRQVFEDVTRTRVDPALLESTEGDNYRLRVYPLPARGTRRVVLEIEQSLQQGGDRGTSLYQLPLRFGSQVGQLDVEVRVAAPGGQKAFATIGGERLALKRQADGSAALSLQRKAFRGQAPLTIALQRSNSGPVVSVEGFTDSSYFYAEVPATLQSQPRPAPHRVALIWDASGSGAGRDHDREFALLDHFLRNAGRIDVQLLVVRDVVEAPLNFSVEGGDWSGLRKHLQQLVYDGATRLEHMAVPAGTDLALMFSDGIGTYGDKGLPSSEVPLFTISASASGDFMRLARAAEQSGGQWLDLLRMPPDLAARELRMQRTRLVGLQSEGVADLLAESSYPQSGRLAIAGRLTQPQARVTLELMGPDGQRFKRTLALEASKTQGDTVAVAARRWASLKLAELEADRARNQQAIRRLGTDFGIVTSGTSLIVLDSVADYARHGIEPPPSLRPAYELLVAQRKQEDQNLRVAQIERVVKRFAETQAWWDRDFPKGDKPKPVEDDPRGAAQQERARASVGMATAPRMAPAPSPPPAAALARLGSPAPEGAATPSRPSEATIRLRKWIPDSPYARRLRQAAPHELYAIYLDERPAYLDSTAFFLDVADILIERGQPELALRVLSNLAEMDLGNRHVLRILAYRLLQAGQVKLALPTLQKVLALSPNEPQSYRDLGLALAADGQPQAAIAQLWEVISRPWHDRFPDIELVALAELNSIVAKAKTSGAVLDTSGMDPRLLRNLPLDLRAVLTWDADNTDIDLWIIDPNGERAFYGNSLTYQGGRLSRDFTGGYGPEEFSLRIAKPGTYKVMAQFYGHNQQVVAPATTLMLRLSTHFGTPSQKDSDIVLRLAGRGQEVTVGTFEVKAGASPD
jgi:Ca-activated chloride channel homolog